MDHATIEEQDVAGRYLRGELGPREAAGFEQHLLACDACFEQVEREGELRRSFAAWAAQETARTGRAGWLLSRRRLALAAVALLAVGLPSVLLLWREGDLRRQLAAERSRSAALDKELTGPRINTPIVPLGTLRDPDQAAATVIALGAEPRWIVLTIELPAVEFSSYRATLERADGTEMWHRDGLVPDRAAVVSIALHTRSLGPGDYLLRLEGLGAGGAPVPAGVYRFRVVAE